MEARRVSKGPGAGVEDAVGNQLSARDFDGAYTMTYDALNRVTTVHDLCSRKRS